MGKGAKSKNQSNDYYFQALMTEYSIIRDSSLSRDTVKQTIENFIIIILSALIASYPLIIKEELILLFPIASIILTSLALTRHRQQLLLINLNEYEKILQKNLVDFIKSVRKTKEKSPPSTDLLWNWQNFLKSKNRTANKLTILWIFKRGISSLSAVLPFFVALMFVFHKSIETSNYIDFIVFILAVIYSLGLFFISIIDYVRYLKAK